MAKKTKKATKVKKPIVKSDTVNPDPKPPKGK
jgi:hypothetical protein